MIEFTISRDHPAELEDFLANRSSRTPVLPETELAVFLRNPAMLQMMLENHHEMMRSGFAGIVSDDLALAAPWDFDIADILVPVYLWHGECDAIVPIHHAEHLAAGIPQSILHRCPNEGHFEMLCRQREVLASLLSFPRSPDNS